LHELIVKKKRDKFEEYEIASVIQQIIQAVNYLHKNNIVHRDLKPDNVVFVKKNDFRIKLIDFATS